jgi:uncharacterized protein YndB with AHSA1/START domain
MQPPEGELFHLVGEYVEVRPPSRLAYTFRWEPPDPDDREAVARIALRERASQPRSNSPKARSQPTARRDATCTRRDGPTPLPA